MIMLHCNMIRSAAMLDSHATDNLPRGTICIEDIEIGMTRHLRKQITDRDIALFAEVSTDHNPFHLDDEYARDTIFGGRIAHGMLTAGLISAVIGASALPTTATRARPLRISSMAWRRL